MYFRSENSEVQNLLSCDGSMEIVAVFLVVGLVVGLLETGATHEPRDSH